MTGIIYVGNVWAPIKDMDGTKESLSMKIEAEHKYLSLQGKATL